PIFLFLLPNSPTPDLHSFPTRRSSDLAFGLPAASFTKVSQTGTSTYPGVDSTGGWETEIALDVEWAHAIAPAAKILLVEANSSSDRKSTRLNSSHQIISYAVFCLEKKK